DPRPQRRSTRQRVLLHAPPRRSPGRAVKEARRIAISPATLLWVLFLLTLLTTTAVRLRLLDVPLERDEGEYAYSGRLLIEGVPPYSLAYNMKLPGTYVAYAAIMAVFGQTPRAIHLGLLLVNLATVASIVLLARRLFDSSTAAAARAAFPVPSLSQGVYGVFTHATHFVILPVVAGAVLLLRAGEADRNDDDGRAGKSRRAFVAAASGLLFGVAFVMKQHGIFFILFAVAWLSWERI